MTAQTPNTFEEAATAMQVIDQHIKDLTTYREQKAEEIERLKVLNQLRKK